MDVGEEPLGYDILRCHLISIKWDWCEVIIGVEGVLCRNIEK